MKVNINNYNEIHFPVYILEENLLRNNLHLIKRVSQAANIEIILAFKAFALWKTFPIFREYIQSTTASSVNEARMAFEKFGHKAHTYSPAYTAENILPIAQCSSHITFNSLSQYQQYVKTVKKNDEKISIGLRINPEYSEIETDIYNPCSKGTRFGIVADKLPKQLPEYIEGFHCHCHCESSAETFVRTLTHIEEKFSSWFPQLKWINFGGGHLMTRKDYNVELLISTLNDLHKRYPKLHFIMEPGSAFAWQTGPLVSQVVDIVEDHQIRTAILNVSFACHMPDCLEMPYKPNVRGAETVDLDAPGKYVYRLGGSSCLSGDYMGSWKFDHELQVGENIILEDMIHYTTVKTTMFNGVHHPSIGIIHSNGEFEILKDFLYEDYLNRMD